MRFFQHDRTDGKIAAETVDNCRFCPASESVSRRIHDGLQGWNHVFLGQPDFPGNLPFMRKSCGIFRSLATDSASRGSSGWDPFLLEFFSILSERDSFITLKSPPEGVVVFIAYLLAKRAD